ncbi:hypothetical protein NKH18_46130 [Streptomyces sp. M10(2022)]
MVFWFAAGWLLLLALAIVFVQWLPLAEDRDVAATVLEPVFAPRRSPARTRSAPTASGSTCSPAHSTAPAPRC